MVAVMRHLGWDWAQIQGKIRKFLGQNPRLYGIMPSFGRSSLYEAIMREVDEVNVLNLLSGGD